MMEIIIHLFTYLLTTREKKSLYNKWINYMISASTKSDYKEEK